MVYDMEFNKIRDGLVSIIMPAYNSEKYIGEAIDSILIQTYKNWELIIVDDCSEDNTVEIINEYASYDLRIKCISLKTHKGVACARNIAISNSSGRYIAFLDSDDLWLEEKLEKQITFMRTNGYIFTYHSYGIFSDNVKANKVNIVPDIMNYDKLLKGNNTGSCLAVCIDRYFIRDIFMPDYKHEDYICWLNILKNYKINAYGLTEVYGMYRLKTKSVSSNKFYSILWTWKVYRESQNLPFLKSCICMMYYIFYGLKKYKGVWL